MATGSNSRTPRRSRIDRIRRALRLHFLRLFRLKDSHERIARGFAVGLIINFIPTFGFGVLVSGIAAKLVGGNGIAGLIGGAALVFVSPLLFSLDFFVGRWLTHFPILASAPAAGGADLPTSSWGKIVVLGTLANCLAFGIFSYLGTRLLFPLIRPWALKQLRSKPRPSSSPPQLTALFLGFALLPAGFLSSGCKQESSTTTSSSSPSTLPPAAHTPPETDATIFGRYAGSASCKPCHTDAFKNWELSHHRNAERPWDPTLDSPPFSPSRTIQHGTNSTVASLQKSSPTLQDTGHQAYLISRVIGHHPLRQFVTATSNGRLQVSELAWDPHQSEWFNIFGNENRHHGEWGHWTGRGMNWNSMCSYCHNTRLLKNYQPTSDSYSTAAAEQSVGCEACHGPMKAHVDWRLAQPTPSTPDPALTQRLTKSQHMDTCGTCHSRRNELTGDFVPGQNFHDSFALALTDESDTYFPDGQVRDEDYEFASFLSSKMHAAGVTCLDCHEPHSGKTRAQGNDLCLRCHNGSFPKAPIIQPTAHTFHQPSSTGSQCVACHMPTTTYMQRHPRHDHSFTTPDPLLTVELGIPNACNRCHTDRTTDWAIQHAQTWYGPKLNRPSRDRARIVASARQADPKAPAAILAWLDHETSPAWIHTLLRVLDPNQIVDPDSVLTRWSTHSSPLVRAAVARVADIAPPTQSIQTIVSKLQSDPSRSVRIAALWTGRANLSLNHPSYPELERYLAFNSDQPAGQLNRGAFYLSQNQPAKALPHYEKAVTWDPWSAPIRHDYAMVLSQSGQPQRALEQLEQSTRLEPRNADYLFKLALAQNELGRQTDTLQTLEKTVALDPKHARAWYNLGLLRNALKDPAGGIEALRRAESWDPRNAQIPYARATIHAQLGQLAEAQQAIHRVLELQPGSQDAQLLLQSLGR